MVVGGFKLSRSHLGAGGNIESKSRLWTSRGEMEMGGCGKWLDGKLVPQSGNIIKGPEDHPLDRTLGKSWGRKKHRAWRVCGHKDGAGVPVVEMGRRLEVGVHILFNLGWWQRGNEVTR